MQWKIRLCYFLFHVLSPRNSTVASFPFNGNISLFLCCSHTWHCNVKVQHSLCHGRTNKQTKCKNVATWSLQAGSTGSTGETAHVSDTSWNNSGIWKTCEKLLTYLLVTESSHLFFLPWPPDCRPQIPLPPSTAGLTSPPQTSSTIFLMLKPFTNSPCIVGSDAGLRHISTGWMSVCFLSVSLPAPSKTPPPLRPSFFFLPPVDLCRTE